MERRNFESKERASNFDGHAILAAAMRVACEMHGEQVRKGTTIPYVSHLLQVAGLALEYGGSLIQATAAVLHDIVEDTDATSTDIRVTFGDEVADIVDACTDTAPSGDATAKAPWCERKEAWLARLATVSTEAALVIACDKLHNLRTQRLDLLHGTAARVKFNAPLEDRVWLARETRRALAGKISTRLEVDLAGATCNWISLARLQDEVPA